MLYVNTSKFESPAGDHFGPSGLVGVRLDGPGMVAFDQGKRVATTLLRTALTWTRSLGPGTKSDPASKHI